MHNLHSIWIIWQICEELEDVYTVIRHDFQLLQTKRRMSFVKLCIVNAIKLRNCSCNRALLVVDTSMLHEPIAHEGMHYVIVVGTYCGSV